MPLPVRHLPVLQNWDCHECGQCCKEYAIDVTDDEKRRIEEQGWDKRPEFKGVKLFVRRSFLSHEFRLNHKSDGACVFLDDRGRCRIHAEFGSTQKPLACQLYPYVLIPAGDQWRVGVRYACPSATANKGRPVSNQQIQISSYAHQLEEREGVRGRSLNPPRLSGWHRSSWGDLERCATALVKIIVDADQPLEFRWRWALRLAKMCRRANFDDVSGRRLSEFLDLMTPAVRAEIPISESDPSRIAGMLFRLTAALYSRRDTGAKRGRVQRNRLALLRAAFRFAKGSGPVPRIHALMPEISFEEMEKPAGTIPAESIALFERYYRTKLESFQFFGPIHYHDGFWNGLEALALTFPVTLWLSRAFRQKSRADAIETALQIVDDNFGYNPLLGAGRQKWATRIMAARGELQQLISWYAR